MDRLAFLERRSRGVSGEKKPATPSPGGVERPVGSGLARYARFRQVASLLFALGLLAVLWGLVAIVLAVATLLRGELTFFSAMGRIVAWGFATTVSYGILKSFGEALLLWADMAELANTQVELTHWQLAETKKSVDSTEGAPRP